MRITYGEAIQRNSERIVDNLKDIKQKNLQRRTNFTHIYGQPFHAQGDGGSPARIYVSVPKSLDRWMRYEYKIIIEPFATTISGGGTQSATVAVDDRSLSVSGNSISPNPHDHTTRPHTHNVTAGIGLFNTDSDDFSVTMSGHDVTPYLMAQYDGEWINGEGIYPGRDIEEDNYDVLQVVSDMTGAGIADADNLLEPGLKTISIASNKPFGVTFLLYADYSHVNR